MNKDEILERYRKNNSDEGYEFAISHGRHRGIIIFLALLLFIIIYNRFVFNQFSFAPSAMFAAYFVSEHYSRYKFTKKKSDLFFLVLGIILLVFSLYHFIRWGN